MDKTNQIDSLEFFSGTCSSATTWMWATSTAGRRCTWRHLKATWSASSSCSPAVTSLRTPKTGKTVSLAGEKTPYQPPCKARLFLTQKEIQTFYSGKPEPVVSRCIDREYCSSNAIIWCVCFWFFMYRLGLNRSITHLLQEHSMISEHTYWWNALAGYE